MTQNRVMSQMPDNGATAAAPVMAGKNKIVNGGFDLWTKGTTLNNVSNDTYTADHWIMINDAVGTINITQQNIASQGLGLNYALRFEKSAGASNRFVLINLEQNVYDCIGKTVTFSFYARKGSALTSDLSVSISTRASKYGPTYDAGGGTVSNSSLNTSTFTRFSYTFPITTASTTNNAIYFETEFALTQAGASGAYIEIAGVQLEIGSIATPFTRSGGNSNLEVVSAGSYQQDGVLVSTAAYPNTYTTNTGSGNNAWAGYVVAGKNYLINGAFDYWQRGTTSTTVGAYLADRWYSIGTGPVTYSQDTGVPTGFKYSIKSVAGGTGAYAEHYQAIENALVTSLLGKTITLSAYVIVNGTYSGNPVVGIQTNATSDAMSGGTWTEPAVTSNIAANTSTWTRISVTYTIPTSNITGVRVRLGNSATQVNGGTIWWAGVQLEVGSVVTPFSRAGGTLQGELAACQRYYYQQPTLSGQGGPMFLAYDTSNAFGSFPFPVTMRVTPTVTIYNTAGTSGGANKVGVADITGVAAYQFNTTGLFSITKSGGLTAGSQYISTVSASAEL